MDTLTVDGFLEGGIAVNPSQPFNGLNWGHLYTDRANTPLFNSAVLTVQRPLDPKAEGFDYGFKVSGHGRRRHALQPLYGRIGLCDPVPHAGWSD